MEQHQTFKPHVTNVASARRFVGGMLAGWGIDPTDVCLLTSEVVTNAVVHGRTDVTVTVKLLDGTVRVEVIDGNPRSPLISSVPPDATAGRGMWMVQSVAQSWGVQRTPVRKTVWFEVARTPPRS